MGDDSGKQKANQMAQQNYSTQNKQQEEFQNLNRGAYNTANARSDAVYNQLGGAYGSLVNPAALTVPHYGGTAQGTSQGTSKGTPQAAPFPNLRNDILGGYVDFSKTGGYNPSRLSSLESSISGLKTPGVIGATSADSAGRIRGSGVYDEFARTGGFTPGDIQGIRARANSPISSMFSSLQNQADRGRLIGGGYGPGTSALSSRLARGQAGAIGENSRNTELGIADQIRANRMGGAQALSGAESGLEGIRTGIEGGNVQNRMQSLIAALGGEQGLQESINRGRQFGLTNAQGMSDADRSFAQSQASNAVGATRWQQSFDAAQRQQEFENNLNVQKLGLGGLGSLYTDTPASLAVSGQGLQGAGVYGGLQNQTVGQYYGGNPATHWYDALGGVGSAAGGVGGLIGAF